MRNIMERSSKVKKYKKEEPKAIKDYCPLKSIEFVKEFRCFKKKEKYEFRPGINLLVGDQGCGKSSLLSALLEDKNSDWKLTVHPTEFLFLDTEHDNPRMADLQYGLPHMDMGDKLISHFMSHGQAFLPRLIMLKKAKNYLVFIDEPEAALSIRSQLKIADAIKTASVCNQFVISTHSQILINLVDEVLDLESKKWVSTEEFIKNQHNTDINFKPINNEF